MDFNKGTLNESQIFSITDKTSSISPPGPVAGGERTRLVLDQSASGCHGGFSTLGRDSISSPDSSRKLLGDNGVDRLWIENMSVAPSRYGSDLVGGGQGGRILLEKISTSHRIQRRRIQNRNAQRNFRRRQENERRMLEQKLHDAEQQCHKLDKACNELNFLLNTTRDRLKQLEDENTVLRIKVYSQPLQKGSS